MTSISNPIRSKPAFTAALRMSEAEFVDWCGEDTRAEWVDGEVFDMAPANIDHVRFDVWLINVLSAFVEHHDLGVVLGPQAQIRLPRPSRREPDVLFIAKDRLDIIKKTYIEGAPDLIVEIVSPESIARDWREKYLEYEAAGVREYWVLDPAASRFEAYTLTDGRYARISESADRVASTVMPGLFLRPSWLTGGALPKVAEILSELGLHR